MTKPLFNTNTKGARERMESARGFRKYFKAKEYEEVARVLFIIVETASRRAADQNLMAQISEAIAERATQPPPLGTTSTHSNPFSDSHETSSLTDVDVGNLNQVEMSIFESDATGEAAIVLGLHNRDGTIQEVGGTIPFAAISGESQGAFGPTEAGGVVAGNRYESTAGEGKGELPTECAEWPGPLGLAMGMPPSAWEGRVWGGSGERDMRRGGEGTLQYTNQSGLTQKLATWQFIWAPPNKSPLATRTVDPTGLDGGKNTGRHLAHSPTALAMLLNGAEMR
ncbi:hypothetical protein EI94DRAFT_1698599 [Lactarius quietus]|nr:hypothetical protein EI94DRAFT_1698599 [Lactarius quietus]